LSNRIFNVLIIGAGNIGAGFDSPDNSRILTHAHAFSKHPGFRLVGFLDSDLSKAQKAASVWGGKAFRSVKDAFNDGEIDIVAVAVPDELHYSVLMEIGELPIKAVLAEKPLARKTEEALEIYNHFSKRSVPVCVNYTRRFVSEFDQIKNNISSGHYGEFQTGTGYYGKGILHNGSHLVDLVRFLIDEITDCKPLERISDFYQDDPTVSAKLSLRNGRSFFLRAIDCRNYTVFEADFFFAGKRIRILDSGSKVEEFDVCDNPVFKGYKSMVKTKENSTSLDNAMYSLVNNMHENLTSKIPLKCTAEDGLRAVQICNRLR
jgi:predicted dehydrogenase